jgi:AcrR family transcriptional regulator
MPRFHDDEIDRRILDSALIEIDLRGFVGLRVADVAGRATTTVAMIYRRFNNRDDLIAATLGKYYEERFAEIIATTRMVATATRTLTIDDVIDAVAPLRFDGSTLYHQRMQKVYAAAAGNHRLREVVRTIARRRLAEYESLVASVVERLPEEQRFDPRIMPIVLLRHNALIDDVLGPDGLSDAEFREFLRSLLVNSGRARFKAATNAFA